jgi:rod shape-determining protein MreD
MKLFLIYIFFAYLAAAVQGLFFHGIKPDLVLVLVCFYSDLDQRPHYAAYGAVTGLLLDTASGFIIGPNILSKVIVAYLARTVRNNLFQWNIIISTSMIVIFSVVDILVTDACLETFSKISFVNRSWSVSVVGTVYTGIAAMILYPVFNRGKDRGLA